MVELSQDTIFKLGVMLDNEVLRDEIVSRLTCFGEPIRTMEQANAIGETTFAQFDDKITQVFKTKMANYDHGECGLEIAKGLNGCLKVLEQAKAGQTPNIQELMGEKMDKVAFEALILALASNQAAKEFRKAYDKMFDSLVNINLISTTKALSPEYDYIPPHILVNAKTDKIHKETSKPRPVDPKRIKRIRLKKDN